MNYPAAASPYPAITITIALNRLLNLWDGERGSNDKDRFANILLPISG
jgi:hypothetical protein